MSSQMAYVGGIDRAVYSASKHALEGMIKSMAIEWGDKGKNCILYAPPLFEHVLYNTFQNPELDIDLWIKEKIKIGRVGTVPDVMGAIFVLGFRSVRISDWHFYRLLMEV